jgi:hypothetical protein
LMTQSTSFGCPMRLGARPPRMLGQRPRCWAAPTILLARGQCSTMHTHQAALPQALARRPCAQQCRRIKQLWLQLRRGRPSDRCFL